MKSKPRHANTPGNDRRQWRYREHEAEQLYQAEMRHFISQKSAQGLSDAEIAKLLQVPPRVVREFLQVSINRVQELQMAGVKGKDAKKLLPAKDATLTRDRVRRGAGAGTHRKKSPKVLTTRNSQRLNLLQQQAWNLRKRAMPYDQIALTLRISETEARQLVKNRSDELDAQELESADEARLLMVAQIDAMMAALATDATGTDAEGNTSKVVYEAIDRMVKLMDQKAKLLGLNKATKVDMTIRLKEWSEQSGYAWEEVEAVAAEVVTAMSRRD